MRTILLVFLCFFGLMVGNWSFSGLGGSSWSKWENLKTHDLLLSLFGKSSLASDLAMIELMISYGGHEELGQSPSLIKAAKRLVLLDPFFRYGIYFGAGALAFTLNQDQEAVELLDDAIKEDSRHWPYSLYLSAIAYKKTNDYLGVLKELEKIRRLPECPTMLKNIMANIYMKLGDKEAARLLYEEMLLAPELEYRELAQRKLQIFNARRSTHLPGRQAGNAVR